MKNITSVLMIIFISLTSFAYSQKENNEAKTKINHSTSYTNVKFKLFETNDKWIFIKLNTQNGLMWQVKFDIDSDDRFETNLNTLALVEKENEVNNRFTLYPTSNIYTFILMDQMDGKMWQVHWSTKSDERAIIPIN